jgi:hypothetical protein
MKDFILLANLYFKRKKKRKNEPKTRLLKEIEIDHFRFVFKSVINMFNFLQFDTEDKQLIQMNKLQYIQNFYSHFIDEFYIKDDNFHDKLNLDNSAYKNEKYYEYFGDFIMSFNLRFSSTLKDYLMETKKRFSTQDLNIIIFFILILKCNSDFQSKINGFFRPFNIFQ